MEHKVNSKHCSIRIGNIKYSDTPNHLTAIFTEMEDTARHAYSRITRTSFLPSHYCNV